MPKINFLNLLLWSSLFLHILATDSIIYEEKTIEDMKSSLWNSNSEGFYHLKGNLIPSGETIIALTSMEKVDKESNGYTDIITYIYDNVKNVYTFKIYLYNKEELNFKIAEIFELNATTNTDIKSLRNLYVGKFADKSKCFLISFNDKNNNDNNKNLIHYIKCGDDKPKKIDNIKSNIIIVNSKSKKTNNRIVYQDHQDNKLKICELDGNLNCANNNIELQKGVNDWEDRNDWKLSLNGGLAYVDVDGNCSPDIILSLDKFISTNNIDRKIVIYTSDRQKDDIYTFAKEILIHNASYFGSFTISRINNDIVKDDDNEYAPQLDILIPKIDNSKQIYVFKNKIRRKYKWDEYFCVEKEYREPKSEIFDEGIYYDLEDPEGKLRKLDDSNITVIRPGDFLSSGLPGLLVKEIIEEDGKEKTAISLYEKIPDNNKFKLYLRVTKGEIGNATFGIFFDINESGSLGLIVQNDKLENHFIYNYRKNAFFVKAKLMNDRNDYYDVNVGATFRYIVTDANTERKMDISYQLAQTSDMNIPVPFSLKGLGETSNYVENFQIISGNYYENKELFDDEDRRNFRDQTPIVPNTQMAAFKFMNKDDDEHLYEWYLDLFVSPTDSLLIIALVIVIVMLIILGIIIYLHVREVKEEQKETNKFKSWFA